MASSSADWVLGVARLISSARRIWLKTGPCWKRNSLPLLGVDDDGGAGDVGGHEVGRELDAPEVEREGAGKGADEEGFTEAGDAFKQRMPVTEEADEDAVDDVFLSDDNAPDLLADGGVIGAEIICGLGGGFWGEIARGESVPARKL